MTHSLFLDYTVRYVVDAGLDDRNGTDGMAQNPLVRSLERMCRLFILVLLAAQFVFYLMDDWPARAVLWLRQLAGKLVLS